MKLLAMKKSSHPKIRPELRGISALAQFAASSILAIDKLSVRFYKEDSKSVLVVVAQLVEHWIVIPVVAGSSPVDHPIFILSQKCIQNKLKITRSY